MSCWSPDFGKQMKRKEDRRDNIVYEIRQVIKRRKIFGSPPLVASDCTRWERCGVVGDVVSFVIQMRIPLPSRQLLHHAGSRVTRLGWLGWAGLGWLGWAGLAGLVPIKLVGTRMPH